MTVQIDIDALREITESGPTPLFATVSGAHLYGFESSDSDVDLRGAFVMPLKRRLCLAPDESTLTISRDGDIELDWVAHDVRKFAGLMLKRNGYVLEQLFSPHVVVGGPYLEELRAIGRGCIVRHLVHHYRGFAATQRKLLAKPGATVKELLYAYRVYLTGVHVLSTGRVEAHLPGLLSHYRCDGVAELVERKRTGTEKGTLAEGELAAHLPALDRLEDELTAAFDRSSLPDEPTSRSALDDYVVRICLELGDA